MVTESKIPGLCVKTRSPMAMCETNGSNGFFRFSLSLSLPPPYLFSLSSLSVYSLHAASRGKGDTRRGAPAEPVCGGGGGAVQAEELLAERRDLVT